MPRTKDTLSAAEVRTALFQGKAQKLFDGGGLFLHVVGAGKYWRLKYRFGGREKLLSLGVYPQVSLQDARKRRDEARELLGQGIDPGDKRKAQKQIQSDAAANSFEAVAREWWHTVHAHRVVGSHSKRNLRRLELHVFPPLGRRPISEITAPDYLSILRQVEKTGHLDTVHRLKSLGGQIFRYGISTGRCDRDPTQDLRDLLVPSRTRHYPAVTDPGEIAPLLRAIDAYAGQPATRGALRLAAILFCRPGELRKALWADFDLDAGTWNYTPSKRKSGLAPEDATILTPLPRQAVEVLREMQSLSGHGQYVFPSARTLARPMSENTVNAALHRLDYKDAMTGHGFRAMARTVLAERLGFPVEIIEMQLAHAVRDPLGRAYNRTTYLEQRGKMLQAWADYLDALREGEGKVIPLRNARA